MRNEAALSHTMKVPELLFSATMRVLSYIADIAQHGEYIYHGLSDLEWLLYIHYSNLLVQLYTHASKNHTKLQLGPLDWLALLIMQCLYFSLPSTLK